jgi:hypothetical protein
MALKLLNPGTRPLGTFDLDDAHANQVQGGDYVQLAVDTTPLPGVEGYAADVGAGPMGPGAGAGFAAPILWNMRLDDCVSEVLGGLADEGVDEYGTLFGSLIGSSAGRATSVNGAVVIGPSTNRGSGKVTVWANQGMYGVNGDPATQGTDGAGTSALSGVTAVNDQVFAMPFGTGDNDGDGQLEDGNLVLAGATNDALACFVGLVADSSLVSTTNAAAGVALAGLAPEYHALYLFGPSKA